GARHDHEVALPGRAPGDESEAVPVVAAGPGGHHLYGAAGQAERHRPQAGLARPVHHVVHRGEHQVVAEAVLYEARALCHRARSSARTHSRSPLRHTYARATTRMAMKTSPSRNASIPSCLKTTAQGSRNTASTSNTMKMRANT